jgi:hypothetical protein
MSFASRLSHLTLLPLLVSAMATLIPHLASAQTLSSSTLIPSEEPLDTELLKPDLPYRGGDIITANTISQTGITVPSLWWAKQQFDEVGGKLVNNWIAYQDEKRIDLVVNRQPWSLLDYLGKYRLVNKFGAVARDNNYNLRVFSQQAALLATYTCNYAQPLPDCTIKIVDAFGRDGLPVLRPPLGGE